MYPAHGRCLSQLGSPDVLRLGRWSFRVLVTGKCPCRCLMDAFWCRPESSWSDSQGDMFWRASMRCGRCIYLSAIIVYNELHSSRRHHHFAALFLIYFQRLTMLCRPSRRPLNNLSSYLPACRYSAFLPRQCMHLWCEIASALRRFECPFVCAISFVFLVAGCGVGGDRGNHAEKEGSGEISVANLLHLLLSRGVRSGER